MIAPRTQSWLLVGSLSFNLFFAGLFAAHAMRPHVPRGHGQAQGYPCGSADSGATERHSEWPGAKPPGAKPPGAKPPGAKPPGAKPPGAEPRGPGNKGPNGMSAAERRAQRDENMGAANGVGRMRGGARGPHGMDVMRDMVAAIGGRNDPRVAGLWKEGRAELRAKRQELLAAQAQVNAALMQEPFNADALKSAFAKLNEDTGKMQSEAQQAIIDLAQTLTPEERTRLRELLKKRGDSAADLR